MTDINHVILIGRLTADAELKYTSTGYPVSKFSIAVNRRKKNGDRWVDEANFFIIVLWGKIGESLSQYLRKGTRVAIDGELKQNRWEKDGQPRSRIEIITNSIQLLGESRKNQNGGQNSIPQVQKNDNREFMKDDFEDDIPF
ncbi:MAG: single-stranded DNA-binding protein [Spirochaetales bacterium]|nr:single-stranded DNA-binding protein [Spirochaetales bacterium]